MTHHHQLQCTCTLLPCTMLFNIAHRSTQQAPPLTHMLHPLPTCSTPYPTCSTPYPTCSTPYPTCSTPYPTCSTPYPTCSSPYPTPYPTQCTSLSLTLNLPVMKKVIFRRVINIWNLADVKLAIMTSKILQMAQHTI